MEKEKTMKKFNWEKFAEGKIVVKFLLVVKKN